MAVLPCKCYLTSDFFGFLCSFVRKNEKGFGERDIGGLIFSMQMLSAILSADFFGFLCSFMKEKKGRPGGGGVRDRELKGNLFYCR